MYTALQKLECLDCKITPDEVHGTITLDTPIPYL